MLSALDTSAVVFELDAVVIPGWVALPGYNTMIGNRRRWFGTSLKVVDHRAGGLSRPNTDVLHVPCDFRRSDADAAETAKRWSLVDRQETSALRIGTEPLPSGEIRHREPQVSRTG